MASEIPYVTLSGLLTLPQLTPQLTQNMQAIQAALDKRVVGRVAVVTGYSATGATTTKIALPIALGMTPYAVQLARVQSKIDPAADMTVVPRHNFSISGSSLWVYEPGGLVANTVYDLTFMIMEA